MAKLCIRRWIFIVHVVSRKVFEITLAVDRLLNTSYTWRNFLFTMAEGSSENLNTSIRELLAEVRDQKRHINSIQEEVRANSAIVSSHVKKLKAEQEYTWKRPGNKIQFQFNSEVQDNIKQCLWALENEKLDYVRELLQESESKVKQRNKLIKIADSSEGGWETVRQYESNPVASNSDDETRISKAEYRAVRKRKNAVKTKFSRTPTATVSSGAMSSIPFGAGYPYQQPGPALPAFAPPFVARPQFFRASPGNAMWSGGCFSCGDVSHFRRDCPYYASGPRQPRPALPATPNPPTGK